MNTQAPPTAEERDRLERLFAARPRKRRTLKEWVIPVLIVALIVVFGLIDGADKQSQKIQEAHDVGTN